MLRVVDVGNTQTVIGLYAEGGSGGDTGELLHHWRIATNVERTSDEHAVLVSQLLDLQGYEPTEVVTGISISSTVPRLTAVMREMAEQWFRVPTVVVEPGIRTGMPILYDNPKEVGADRIANAVAAFDLYGGPCIVVDFGTATTVDATSGRGEYLGGAIMPGIEISMAALFERAARLFGVELVEPRNVIGTSTTESVQSGVVYGFAAQVDGLCRRFQAELGDCPVVATGGFGALIAPVSETIDHEEPWLTLHGLRLIYERNVQPR